MYHRAVLAILFFLLYSSLGYEVFPCCQIRYMAPDTLGSLFSAERIFLPKVSTCHNTNVAQIRLTNDSSNVSRNVCANGFSVMSFLITLLQRLDKEAYETEKQLLSKLKENIDNFYDKFDRTTTDSSKYNLSRIIQPTNGRVA